MLSERLEAVKHGEIQRLMVFMPPRHGKSELCSIRFPAWYLGHYPQRQIIGCSYAESLAYTFSYAIREIISTLTYQRLWPYGLDQAGATKWQIAGKENQRASYIAAGVGGGISGEGADLLIIDDPVKNAQEAQSALQRERVWEWYRTVARTRLQPNGAVVLIMTRWHVDDLAGRLLNLASADKRADQWEVLKLPDLQHEEALWPEQYDVPAITAIRASIGGYGFEALYQCNPIMAEGNMWKWAWIDDARKEKAPQLQRVVVAIDPAAAHGALSDETGIAVCGVGEDGKYYVLHVAGYRLSPQGWAKKALDLFDQYECDRIVAEINNGGEMVEHTIRSVRGTVPIKVIHASRGKAVRAEPVASLYEQGKVHHVGTFSAAEDQMCSFPVANENDDMVDALVYALTELIERSPLPAGSVVIDKGVRSWRYQ